MQFPGVPDDPAWAQQDKKGPLLSYVEMESISNMVGQATPC